MKSVEMLNFQATISLIENEVHETTNDGHNKNINTCTHTHINLTFFSELHWKVEAADRNSIIKFLSNSHNAARTKYQHHEKIMPTFSRLCVVKELRHKFVRLQLNLR